MLTALSTPGQRKAAAFLCVFWFAAIFTLLTFILPLTPWSDASIPTDIQPGVAGLLGVALTALFGANVLNKRAPSVREGKEPA